MHGLRRDRFCACPASKGAPGDVIDEQDSEPVGEEDSGDPPAEHQPGRADGARGMTAVREMRASLVLELRAAERRVPTEIGELRDDLSRVAEDIKSVLDDLREMSRGIHPAILARGGLGPALRTLARRAPIPVEVDVRAETRLPEPIEVAAYYVASEALTNAVRHAQASVVRVTLEEQDGALKLSIRDDGVGGADHRKGSGLIGLHDRVEALGGSIDLSSAVGEGTLIVLEFPLRPGPTMPATVLDESVTQPTRYARETSSARPYVRPDAGIATA
jgi:signal transduction histidine kinase